jgi:hypothetical protein
MLFLKHILLMVELVLRYGYVREKFLVSGIFLQILEWPHKKEPLPHRLREIEEGGVKEASRIRTVYEREGITSLFLSFYRRIRYQRTLKIRDLNLKLAV